MIPSAGATWGLKEIFQDNNFGLVAVSLGALLACLALTGGLLAKSSFVKAFRQWRAEHKAAANNTSAESEDNTPNLDLDNAAPAN